MDNNNMSDEFLFKDIEAEQNNSAEINENNEADQYNGGNYSEEAYSDQSFYSQDQLDDYNSYVNSPKEAVEDEEEKTNLGLISFLLFIGSGVCSALLAKLGSESLGESIGAIMALASFVLMIFTRVKFRKDIWGKVTMWLFIVVVGFTLAFSILIVVTCIGCAKGLGGMG